LVLEGLKLPFALPYLGIRVSLFDLKLGGCSFLLLCLFGNPCLKVSWLFFPS